MRKGKLNFDIISNGKKSEYALFFGGGDFHVSLFLKFIFNKIGMCMYSSEF